MNIEEIKSKIAELEPEANKLWEKVQAADAVAKAATDAWYAVSQKLDPLKTALKVLSQGSDQ